MADEEAPETEVQRVIRWRERELRAAGFPQEEAFLVARRTDIDLHTAIDMVAHGCEWRMALKILL